MQQLIRFNTADDLRALPPVAGLPPFEPECLERDRPDAHWALLNAGRAVMGRCSLWWQKTPDYPGHRLGLVGHYAVDKPQDAVQLLNHACSELRSHDCTLAVGPMDGSTWRSYRLVTERGVEPPFFLEPDNPDDWPHHFETAGFVPLAHYTSAVNDDLEQVDPRVEKVEARMMVAGVRIRPVNMQRLDESLHRIFTLCLISFQDNFLYTPVAEEEFLEQYRKLIPVIRPELALLAEREGELVGFVFALPDQLEVRRGQDARTIIVKTLAVLPGRAYAGLGTLLLAHCHAAAHAFGYRRAIHALMHDSNNSRNLSSHTARTIRGYTLYSKGLVGATHGSQPALSHI